MNSCIGDLRPRQIPFRSSPSPEGYRHLLGALSFPAIFNIGIVFRASRCQDSAVSDANPAAGPVSASASPGVFATTHWSVVLAAGQSDSPQAAAALEDRKSVV